MRMSGSDSNMKKTYYYAFFSLFDEKMMIFSDDIAESLVIAGFDIASSIQIPLSLLKKEPFRVPFLV